MGMGGPMGAGGGMMGGPMPGMGMPGQSGGNGGGDGGAFDFMAGAKGNDAFDFVGDTMKQNKRTL